LADEPDFFLPSANVSHRLHRFSRIKMQSLKVQLLLNIESSIKITRENLRNQWQKSFAPAKPSAKSARHDRLSKNNPPLPSFKYFALH
jgi:hypothetical protein